MILVWATHRTDRPINLGGRGGSEGGAELTYLCPSHRTLDEGDLYDWLLLGSTLTMTVESSCHRGRVFVAQISRGVVP